jgi:arginyl-tRNA synthetase
MQDPLDRFRDEARRGLEAALSRLDLEDAVDLDEVLETPDGDGHGDLALPCFPLASAASRDPAEIASDLASSLPDVEGVSARAEGPYLNFTWDEEALRYGVLDVVMWEGVDYGAQPPRDERVIVEHTSANPNGPFHVGRARNPVLGDSVARLLRFCGYDVHTEYYVNDMGRQVALLTWGLDNIEGEDLPAPDRAKPDHDLVRYYQAANERAEEDEAVGDEVDDLLRRMEAGDEEVAQRFREAASTVLDGLRESLSQVDVALDDYVWESSFVRDGGVDEVVDALRDHEAADEDGGAWFVDMEEWGVEGKDTRWFFTREDGTTLYTTRDLAYHMDKFERGDRAVDLLGEDHKLTMRQLEVALDLLGAEGEVEPVWISFVTLPEGSMSTREGRLVTLDDLLDEAERRAYEEVKERRGDELSAGEMWEIAEAVGVGAVRFNIARVRPEKGITFRWEEALNFEGASAPFCQYAHARAAGILETAEQAAEPELGELGHASTDALVAEMARFPEVVRRCEESLAVHPVASYAIDLANAFNAFYRDCPVAEADDGLREARLEVVRAAKQVLENALHLLGVPAPDSM